MKKLKFDTREQWLSEAVKLITPLFENKGPASKSRNGDMTAEADDEAPRNRYKVPKFRVACGWPSVRGLSDKKRVIGESWDSEAASDEVGQIFISPWLNDPREEQGVLATLVHEIVHQVVGHEVKHGKPFRECALAVGLDGKMTATFAGKDLMEFISQWCDELGPYPHGKLDKLKSPSKKQTTRMIKAECSDCGFTVRLSRKWLEEVGAPHCPKHGEMKFEIPEELKEDDTNDDNE